MSRKETMVTINGLTQNIATWAINSPAAEVTVYRRIQKVLAKGEGKYTDDDLHFAVFAKPMTRSQVSRLGAKSSPWRTQNDIDIRNLRRG
jgi:hypothetical protein